MQVVLQGSVPKLLVFNTRTRIIRAFEEKCSYNARIFCYIGHLLCIVRTMPYQYLTLSPKLIKSYNIFHLFLQAVFQLLKFPGAQLPSCSNSRGAQLLVAQFHKAFRRCKYLQRCKYLNPVQILLQHCWYPQESHKNH